ncbi:MAG: ribonuclease P protein component [Chlamydiota bacterium]
MSYRFPKSAHIRFKKDFKKISRKGCRDVGKYIIIDSIAGDTTKLGISASRHYGKAYQRNRFKRLVRESFRHIRSLIPSGLMINVRPRPYAKHASQTAIQQELLDLTLKAAEQLQQ